jgi:hypothetical protein
VLGFIDGYLKNKRVLVYRDKAQLSLRVQMESKLLVSLFVEIEDRAGTDRNVHLLLRVVTDSALSQKYEVGRYLVMVDTPKAHVAEMKVLMTKIYSEAEFQGESSSFNNPFQIRMASFTSLNDGLKSVRSGFKSL